MRSPRSGAGCGFPEARRLAVAAAGAASRASLALPVRRRPGPGVPVGALSCSVLVVSLVPSTGVAGLRQFDRAGVVAAGELHQRGHARVDRGWVAKRLEKPVRGLSMHISITAEVEPSSSPRPSILRSAEIIASGFLVSSTAPASARFAPARERKADNDRETRRRRRARPR